LPELTAESPHHASGNYALTDMIAALKWVKVNIAKFGGDPGKVTIGGQSTGGVDVAPLTMSPLASGLFVGAISESGGASPSRSAAENEKMGNDLLELLHLSADASELEALRALPAATVLASGDQLKPPPEVDPSLLWGQQIVDGWVEPLPNRQVYASHKQAPVPMIIGNNTREVPLELPPDVQRSQIRGIFGARADELLRLYGLGDSAPGSTDPVLGNSATQLITDVAFRCPANLLANRMLSAGVKIWRYQFGLPQPGSTGPVAHNAELKYVFGAAPTGSTFGTWPPVQQYRANFVRTGDPNGPGLPHWPDMGKELNYLSFTPSGPVPDENLRSAVCGIMSSR